MEQGGIMYTGNQINALWPGTVPIVYFTSGLKYQITVKCKIITNTLNPISLSPWCQLAHGLGQYK